MQTARLLGSYETPAKHSLMGLVARRQAAMFAVRLQTFTAIMRDA